MILNNTTLIGHNNNKLLMTCLPTKQFRELVKFLNDEESEKIYDDKEPREIKWKEYTEAQINEAKSMLEFIRESVDECTSLKMKGKIGRPLTNPKILAKAVLLCEYFGFTERKAQGWISIMGPFIGICGELDDRTIGNAYDNTEVLYILNQVFNLTKDSDGVLSGDGSGLERTRKQNYESNKKKYGEYMVNIVDSREIVQTFDISGPREVEIMLNLIEEVVGHSLRLDAGFNCRELTSKLIKLNIIPYIYPKKNNVLNADGSYEWTRMYLEFYLDVIAWLTEYYQRTHAESFYSSFKRAFGIITKIKPMSRLTQVTARIIIHNFRKLEYYKKIS